MVHLDYRDARPIYAQIMDGLRQQITAGVMQPGDKLPSVRELATALAINPNTIQRAYRELEQAGLIATVAGKGCFVCAAPTDPNAELLAQFDRLADALLSAGVTREELAQRLMQGGNDHA